VGGNAVTYTTLTAYRIRSGQITEVRYHVDDVMGYLSFWRTLAEAAPAPEPEAAPEPEPEQEPEPAPEPPRRKLGFARFR
jgi:hypothetical protein